MSAIFRDLAREAVRAPKGTVLMHQGELGRCAYFVLQGRLLVEKENDGEKIVLGEIGPRDLVGEIAIIDDAPRSATVTVVEDAILLQLDKVRIKTIIRKSPEIGDVIMKLLCHKLRQNHDLMRKASALESPESWRKICATLRLCAQGYEKPQEVFYSFLEHVHLFIGTSTARLREILVRLGEAQVIECEGNQIHRVDFEKIDIFLKNSKEDFANEEIHSPTPIKLYQAKEVIMHYYGQNSEEDAPPEIVKNALMEQLITAQLWEDLRPSMQSERANQIIQYFIENGITTPKPHREDTLILHLDKLQEIDIPMEEITKYESMKSHFFKTHS